MLFFFATLEERLGVKMANTLLGRRKILLLWRQQDGFCLVCQQKITKVMGWTNHHMVGKSKAERTVWRIVCCSIQIAINKSIAKGEK
jgi:hypothetical protein